MKRGTGRHPKVHHLRELLKISLAAAIGYLELLWHFAAEFAPEGDIGRYDDARIEAGLSWTGRRGRLIEALIDAGWLDRDSKWRLLVHDWPDHADGVVKKRLERAGLSFHIPTPKVTEQRQPTADNGGLARAQSRPIPVPVPSPSPAPTPGPATAKPEQEQQRALNSKPSPAIQWTVDAVEGAMKLLNENRPVLASLIDITTAQRITENMVDLEDLALFLETIPVSAAKDWGLAVTESRQWHLIRGIAQKQKQAKLIALATRCKHGERPDDCWDCSFERENARKTSEDAARKRSA